MKVSISQLLSIGSDILLPKCHFSCIVLTKGACGAVWKHNF
jgi:hypothetical protein